MNTTVIDHIGIAVNSIDKSLAFWETTLGVKCTIEDRKSVV